MADIVLFKKKDDEPEFWANWEKELTDSFNLSGNPKAIIRPFLDRMRVLQDKCLTVDLSDLPTLSVQLNVNLSEEEVELLKQQLQAHFRQKLYPLFLAKILYWGVAPEVGRIENEIYLLRCQVGA